MTAIQLLLVLGLIPLATFIIRYAIPGAWLETYQGRTLMAQKIAWFFLLLHFLVESIFPYPGHDLVELFIIGACVILFWATLAGLLLAQGSMDEMFAFWRRATGKLPKPFRKVSRKRGTGYVHHEDIEKTLDRRKRR